MASQTLRTLKLSLLADVSNFGSQLDKAGSGFKKFSKGVEQASKFANVAIGAIGAIGTSAVKAASDLDETSSAVEQVFGRRASAQLQEFARNAALTLGQSRQQALEAAQTFGTFGLSAGLAGTELVDFTTKLTTLATDLASFQNTDVDTAINALGAALRGESEPIRQYNVLLNEAALRSRALKEGIVETTNEALTPQQRVLAAYAEILAQTTLQQGDFGRTSEGLAGSTKILQAQLENFRVELGEQLLPVVQELLPQLRGFVASITAVEPERLVAIGKAILYVAGTIKALNVSLRAFAALQGAYKVLTGLGVGGAVAGGVGVAAGLTVATGQNLAPSQATGGLAPSGLGLRGSAAPPPSFAGSAGQRQTGNVIVSGVVGSTYQVTRELERFEALRNRSSGTLPTPGVPQ